MKLYNAIDNKITAKNSKKGTIQLNRVYKVPTSSQAGGDILVYKLARRGCCQLLSAECL